MVYTGDLKSPALTGLWVRVPPRAPINKTMKITKIQVYAKVSDTTKGMYVVVEDVGWLHIAKLPMDCDNIFFSKEELERVAGEPLVLLKEFDVDENDPKLIEWKKRKGLQ